MSERRTPDRRTVLRAAGAVGAALALGPPAAARQSLSVDADNLVVGNGRFTVTVEGVSADEIVEYTVAVEGVAFATVDVLPATEDAALLAVGVENLLRERAVREAETVTVEVSVTTGDGEAAGTDVSHVVTE